MDEHIERLRQAAYIGGIDEFRRFILAAKRISYPVSSTDLAYYVQHLEPEEKFDIRQLEDLEDWDNNAYYSQHLSPENLEDWEITEARVSRFNSHLGQWLSLKYEQLTCYDRPFGDVVYDVVRHTMFDELANVGIAFIGYIPPNTSLNFDAVSESVRLGFLARLGMSTWKSPQPRLVVVYYTDTRDKVENYRGGASGEDPSNEEERWNLNIYKLTNECEIEHEMYTGWGSFNFRPFDPRQQNILISLFQSIPLFIGMHTIGDWVPDFIEQYSDLLAFFKPTFGQLEELGDSMDLSVEQVESLFDWAEPERLSVGGLLIHKWSNYRWTRNLGRWANNFIQFPRLACELNAIEWTDQQLHHHPVYDEEGLRRIGEQAEKDFTYIKNLGVRLLGY